ncbi:MAG: type I-E CRISPR-associated protein Cas6/Cse3/CasE [Thermodesulfobacteriota bacterium]
MYLSKIEVDMYEVRNPYEMHRLIWRLFPGRPDIERPFLYRTEAVHNGKMSLLLQSQIRPEEGSKGIRLMKEPKNFAPLFRRGWLLSFLLRANPVKRLKEARCRVPLIREDEQRAWLGRKLLEAAEPLEVRIERRNTLWFSKANKAGKIATVTYSGLLEVKEPEPLMKLVQSGIGPAKGFGCGLLSLARA